MRQLTVALLVPGLLALGACSTGHGVSIDWVDFVQWNGISYLAVEPTTTPVSESLLGPKLGITKRKLAGNETDPSYKVQEGDAAFLAAGTPIYTMSGYRASYRIAAKNAARLLIYEADTNPKARTGADLVDLDGKVDYMTIGDSNDRELATIRDPSLVAHLVGLILQARVDQSVQPPPAGPQYFVTIRFHDGTQSVRAYWPSTGELSRGILAGPEFGHAILAALPSPAA
jgi:hypothetical protein